MKWKAFFLGLIVFIGAFFYYPSKQIILIGERHCDESCLQQELALWDRYYQRGFRHLFLETPFYTAQYLNLWMQSENDDFLNLLEADWEAHHVASQGPRILNFFKTIKTNYPKTIFHGTDTGHQDGIGPQYLAYLEENNLKDSEYYQKTQEIIDQGNYIYRDDGFDWNTREFMMTLNFIREYEASGRPHLIGIYGYLHIGTEPSEITVPRMIQQLKAHYRIQTHDIRRL